MASKTDARNILSEDFVRGVTFGGAAIMFVIGLCCFPIYLMCAIIVAMWGTND